MTFNKYKPRRFLVSALLDIPGGDEAEYLAVVKQQIADLGKIIKQKDPELFHTIINHFEPTSDYKERLRQELIHHREI